MQPMKFYPHSLGGIGAASGLFVAIALLPMPGWIGASLRYGFGFWIIGFGLLLAWAYRSGRYWSAALLLSICCALSLSGLWANASNELQVLSGFVFFSDAAQYYTDAVRLLEGFPISAFSARHPLSTLFLGALLWMVHGSLQLALLLLALIAFLCIVVAVNSLARVIGPSAASLLVIGLFLFYRRFVGIPNSEQLGLALGCLSLAFLLQAAVEKSVRAGLFGLLFLGLGLAARPGAFLIIFAALFWVTKWVPAFPRSWFASLCMGLAVVSLGVTLTALCNASLAEKGTVAFSNYSYSLYGIVSGNLGWEQFAADHPEALALPVTEAEALAFREAVLVFKADPMLGLRGWLGSYLEYFTTGPLSLYGFVSGGETASLGLPESITRRWVYILVRLLLYALTVLGMGTLWRKRMHPTHSLLFSTGAATLLALSFMPARDAGMMRMHAVSLPYLLCLPSLGLVSFFQNNSPVREQALPHELHNVLATGLILALAMSLLLFTVFTRNLDLSDYDDSSRCDTEQISAVVRIQHGSYLSIIDDVKRGTLGSPFVQFSDFLERVNGFYRPNLLTELAQISPNTILMVYVDLRTGQSAWLIMSLNNNPVQGSIFNVCGVWHSGLLAKGLGFLQAEQVYWISSW